MQLYYYRDPRGNFGDDLNPWLWERLFPQPLETYMDDETLFVGIGSILNQKIPALPAKKIVFGSGHAYGEPPAISDSWCFRCVRGPLTADALELPRHLAISDGAMLVRQVVEPAAETLYPAAFMPHHVTINYDNWRLVCENLSIQYLDPRRPVAETLEIIRHSKVIITEAMHGAIIADALRVPWIPVRTRALINEFKWVDWSTTLGIEHQFEWIPLVWNVDIDADWKRTLHPAMVRVARLRLQWLVKYGRRRLSDDTQFAAVYDRLTDAFATMVADIS